MSRLCGYHGIKTIVETGVWRGYSTRRFAHLAESVIGIEIDRDMAEAAKATCAELVNVRIIEGDSSKMLGPIIGYGMTWLAHPALYYLDAHWREYSPLIDEIDAIAEHDAGPAVIIIHDCEVPGKDFGFDPHPDGHICFELVKPYLDKLKFKWRHYFNSEADGHRRGVLFVVPE